MVLWFKSMLRTPKTQLGILLCLILFSAFVNSPSPKIIELFLTSVVSCVLFDFLFLKIRRIQLFFPSAAIVSAIIITLLTTPSLPLYVAELTAFLAMSSKNFIRIGQKHVFNPAGFGILLSAFLFRTNVSWWAVSWQSLLPILLLLTPLYVSIFRMRRHFIIFPFLATYLILRTILAHSFFQSFLIDPTLLFFAAVMLPEPMTTPSIPLKQTFFGIFVAVFSILLPISFDPLIFSLLLGNTVFFFLRRV